MRRVTICFLLGLLSLNLTGCGGCSSGTSEAEMRRRAGSLKRAPEYDDDEPAATAAQTATVEAATSIPPVEPDPPAVPAAAPASTPIAPPPPSAVAGTPSPAAPAVEAAPAPTPATPLSSEAARARSVANLEKISAALLQYVSKKGQGNLPAAAIIEPESRAPLLSWRVELLPYLGHEALYKQFHHNEAWNSAHNRKLLEKIPAEYQSPERFDTRTNYQVVTGPLAAFSPTSGQSPRLFEAGASNVIMLVEVDDALAAPWTKPQEYTVDPKSPLQGLGSLRNDGFFAILADGLVCKVPTATGGDVVRNLFAIEPKTVIAGTIVTDPLEGNTPPAAATASGATSIPTTPSAPTQTSTTATATSLPKPSQPTVSADPLAAILQTSAKPPRESVPPSDDLKRARNLIGEMYRQEYGAAKRPEEKRALAEKMLRDSEGVSANAADYYELVRIARDVAVSAGSLELAHQAIERLNTRFEIDGLALGVKTLEDINKASHDQQTSNAVVQISRLLMQQAIEEENFDVARQACDAYLANMRKLDDRAGQKEAGELRQAIDRMQVAYSAVPAAINTLRQDPSDHGASQVVGAYYCFVKGKWDLGLPLLAKAADVQLRGLAMVDLDTTKTPTAMLQLADEYLAMAAKQKPPLDRGMKLRAAHYFALAAQAMPPGLARIKAEKRLDEMRELFGRSWLDETLGLAPAAEAGEADES